MFFFCKRGRQIRIHALVFQVWQKRLPKNTYYGEIALINCPDLIIFTVSSFNSLKCILLLVNILILLLLFLINSLTYKSFCLQIKYCILLKKWKWKCCALSNEHSISVIIPDVIMPKSLLKLSSMKLPTGTKATEIVQQVTFIFCGISGIT